MFSSKSAISCFYETLEYSFKNQALLIQALTRKSATIGSSDSYTEHNERLEFLGDGILRAVVDDILFELYPDATEKTLSEKRDELVSKHGFLVELAEKLNIIELAKMGKEDRLNCAGPGKDKILSDIMEAIIAAIFLDSKKDFSVIRSWVAGHCGLEKDMKWKALVLLSLLRKKDFDETLALEMIKTGANINYVFKLQFYGEVAFITKEPNQCLLEVILRSENLPAFQFLLQTGADVNIKTSMGSLLHTAISELYPSFTPSTYEDVEHLHRRAPRLLCDDRMKYYQQCISLLIKHGADLSMRDSMGKSPLDLPEHPFEMAALNSLIAKAFTAKHTHDPYSVKPSSAFQAHHRSTETAKAHAGAGAPQAPASP